jgi:hypothetical protein
MLTPDFYSAKFREALPYDQYVASGKPHEQNNWNAFHSRVSLSDSQRSLSPASSAASMFW